MKIHMKCWECIKKTIVDNQTIDERKAAWATVADTPAEVQESGELEMTCEKGHVTKIYIRNLKHELLFESGISAIRDGYYREAVASFASALERYLEFTIRVLLAYQHETVNEAEFIKVWKQMAKQSERQFGAFWMAYFSTFNVAPAAFNKQFLDERNINLGIEGNDPVNFRNTIIHQGNFASYNQAVSYGEGVRLYIVKLIESGAALSSESLYNKYMGKIMSVAHNPPYKKGNHNIGTLLNSSPTQVDRILNESLFNLFPLKL